MNRGHTGYYIPISSADEACRAFVPHPLPPNPPLQLDDELNDLREKAGLAVGRLDGLAASLPDSSMFLYSYVRKEAVLSSQIEGTQSSLSDLLLFEIKAAPGVPLDDAREVSNYVAAMNHGLARLKDLPLSFRLIKEIHRILLSRGRGSGKEPGEFRRSQNWIGGTRPGNASFVPPPSDHINECLGALEKFLHNEPTRTPLLIKAALAHAQFETIHPFLDGNGRLGRLLITLLFCAEGALHEPLLYLSLYFKQHREEYYNLLQRIRVEGDWESWVRFFLEGVRDTAEQAARTARALLHLSSTDELKIQNIGRAAGSALRVHRFLQRQPITSVAVAGKKLRLSAPAVAKALNNLQKLGIVHELTGGKYGRLYAYKACLKLLGEDRPNNA